MAIDPLRRLVAVCVATTLPYLPAIAVDLPDKSATPPKPVLLPGEYPVTTFDLARGLGTRWRSCIGHTTFGPGIAPEDLEVTYVKENSIRIAIKGTGDELICGGFYVPALRNIAHKTVFRFYDANRWSFEDIDKLSNLRTLATPAPAGQSSGPAPAPSFGSVTTASAAQISKCVSADGRTSYTEGPCPDKGAKQQSVAPGPAALNAPVLPTVQHGLWKLKVNQNGNESQSEYCGDPLERVADEVAQIASAQQLGCTARTASSAPRNFSVIVDCPDDRVSADGGRRIQKGQASLSLVSPTPQSFTLNMQATSRNYRESVQGVRVGNCD